MTSNIAEAIYADFELFHLARHTTPSFTHACVPANSTSPKQTGNIEQQYPSNQLEIEIGTAGGRKTEPFKETRDLDRESNTTLAPLLPRFSQVLAELTATTNIIT